MKYKYDRDIPDRTWNEYLLKYKGDFRVFRAEDNIVSIKCKYGEITPYSILKKELTYYGEYNTQKKLTYFCKKLPDYCKIIQMGQTEVVIAFFERFLYDLSEVLMIRKKMKYSSEVLEQKRRIMLENKGKASTLKKSNQKGQIKCKEILTD